MEGGTVMENTLFTISIIKCAFSQKPILRGTVIAEKPGVALLPANPVVQMGLRQGLMANLGFSDRLSKYYNF